MNRKYVLVSSFCLILIATSIGYAFLFEPMHDEYCERQAIEIKEKTKDAYKEAEKRFEFEKANGEYDACENRINPFRFIQDTGEFPSSLSTGCESEWREIGKIAKDIYPELDERSAEVIAEECKLKF